MATQSEARRLDKKFRRIRKDHPTSFANDEARYVALSSGDTDDFTVGHLPERAKAEFERRFSTVPFTIIPVP